MLMPLSSRLKKMFPSRSGNTGRDIICGRI
jgi:hypothetical protein